MKRLIALVILAFPVTAQEEMAVIVNKASTVTHLSKASLRRMLLGEESRWPGGARLTVLIGPNGDPVRAAALERFCGMTESEFGKHQLHANFNGEGKSAVHAVPSNFAVRQLVQLTPGAVGIVPASVVNESVKALKIE